MSVNAPQTILIFRALQLGDLLCATPAFRALRSAYPKAHITLVGLPWAKSFVRRFSSYLDAFIEFPGWPGLPEQSPKIRRIPAFLETIQGCGFDLALQMQGSGAITNPMMELFGARQPAGFTLPELYRPDTGLFTTYPEGEHEIRIWLRLMETLGIPSQGEHLEFPITRAERKRSEELRLQHGLAPNQYVCLHPGARDLARRWTPEKFAVVGDGLARRGYRVVLTGSESESGLTEAIASRMASTALDLAGQTDLGTLALLLANARLLVSNDTGVSHVAAATKTPSVVLFTTADPNRWRPLNQSLHHIIQHSDQVTPEAVLNETEDLLREERVLTNEAA